MNNVVQDMLTYFEDENSLMHYGMPRRSGRYPWGSGENPYQHTGEFLSRISQLKSDGLSEKEIADAMGLSTTQLRVQKRLAKDEERSFNVATAKALREKGYSLQEVANKMGFKNDSSVRSLLNEDTEARMNAAKSVAEFIKKRIDEKGMIDVGAGVERELGVSRNKLEEALIILEREGYPTYGGRVPQVTDPTRQTTLKVVCPPGTEHKEIYDYGNINSLKDYVSYDDGKTFHKSFEYPSSMDSKRLEIRYAEDGGINKDGVIELRRGVADLSLGESKYAQVRILVDNERYLKGMAVYSDDLPDGIDVRFNTSKTKDIPKMDVLKKIHSDPDNPFGSLIKEHGGQSYYTDSDGKEKLSLINKRAEEGDWGDWANKLPSQFLAKQNPKLVQKQLEISLSDKKSEYDEIMTITNPVVKRRLLQSLATDCDAAAVHLKAASLPRQKYQVILPLTSVKDNEVYSPNFDNGETVALVRFPHGGTFEIPILKVNNKIKEGQRVLGTNPKDAIGINKAVADRLSGADFDGDTVMVIPCNSPTSKVRITSTHPLKDLEGFDPKIEYPSRPGMKKMTNTQKEMGVISNLITDMTIKGAPEDHLAKAVRHSMVVIDAEKHGLDYKRSEVENDIDYLKRTYQSRDSDNSSRKNYGGASTLLSRAKSEISVPKRRGSPIINPDGSLSYKSSNETYINKTGDVVFRTQKSTKMMETPDARTLSSGYPVEEMYASYANGLKSLANQSRKSMINTPRLVMNPEAKRIYKSEVETLDSKLHIAELNAPKERQAQLMANSVVNAKKQSNPDMSKDEIKKAKQVALSDARAAVGASRRDVQIEITDKEWEAIQSGAISDSKLSKILNYTDIDKVRERATPRLNNEISEVKVGRIKALSANGYTNAEIAKFLGISTSSVSRYLN